MQSRPIEFGSPRGLPLADAQPWVGRCAARIADPIARLRLLQSVAPSLVRRSGPNRRRVLIPLLLAPLAISSIFLFHAKARPSPAKASVHAPPLPASAAPSSAEPLVSQPNDVWVVEQSAASETYSNGLRIDNRLAVRNHPRSYRVFPVRQPDGNGSVVRSEPAGIVFHTTESRQAPFSASENRLLQRLGESLLEYVQRRRAHNFLIDRFGRVYRIVAESDAANHAGYSVWSDGMWLYVNLNESFLGVAVEAQTQPGQTQPQLSPAQLRAAAMLTEMLRSRYRIAAGNCVTHAQVSVNPSNMRVGYHTDWASSFPFAALGLPDNYALPLPALWAFGFDYDPAFLRTAGARLAAGARLGEELRERVAAETGVSTKSYRAALERLYRKRLADARSSQAAREEGD